MLAHHTCDILGGEKIEKTNIRQNDMNQLARRNLTPDQMSLIRGRRYNRTKKPHGGDRRSESVSSDQNDLLKTAEKLAIEHGVSAPTIRRDSQFAAAVEKVKEIDPEINKKVATGNSPPKKDVINAAKILEENPEEAQRILSGGRTTIKSIGAKIRKENLKKKKEEENSAAIKFLPVIGERYKLLCSDIRHHERR